MIQVNTEVVVFAGFIILVVVVMICYLIRDVS